MKTFHSAAPHQDGRQDAEVKQIITNAATAVGQPPWEKNSTSGTSPSIAVLTWASAGTAGRTQIVGKCSKKARLSAWPHRQAVRHHRGDDEGEVFGEFEVAAPIQITMQTKLRGDEDVRAAEEESYRRTARRPPAAARKMTLSQPGGGQQAQDRPRPPGRKQPDGGPERGSAPVPSGGQRDDEHHQQRTVQRDVPSQLSPRVSGTCRGHGVGSRMKGPWYRIDPIGR